MNYEIKFDEKNQVLYVKTLAMLTGQDVDQMMPQIKKIFEGKERKLVLGDISENPTGLLSKEARLAFKRHSDLVSFDKIAVIGANPATRMIAKVALQVMGKSKISRFLDTVEQALQWLKED